MSAPEVPGYVIGEEIGRGASGAVYRATQTGVGREVALKLVWAPTLDPAALARFERECATIGGLSWHPHVVALHDAGRTDRGVLFMAMELVTGGSLADRVAREGPLPSEEVTRVGLQIGDALQAAHEAGIIHRDVKPENVMIGRRGEALLTDFGIARVSSEATVTGGGYHGTPAYSAPELLRGEPASPRSDIYALGATLHTLATGSAAFAAATDETPLAVVTRVLRSRIPALPASADPSLAWAVAAATDPDPARRPSTAAELRAVLAAARPAPTTRVPVLPPPPGGPLRPQWQPPPTPPLGQGPIAPVRPAPVAPSTHSPAAGPGSRPGPAAATDAAGSRRALPLIALAAAVVVALAAGALVLMARGDEPEPDVLASAPPGSATSTAAFEPLTMTVAGQTPLGALPNGVAAHGDQIWVAVTSGDDLRPEARLVGVGRDGEIVADQALPGTAGPLTAEPAGVIWTVDHISAAVRSFDADTGAAVDVAPAPGRPGDVLVDEGRLWLSGFASGQVSVRTAREGIAGDDVETVEVCASTQALAAGHGSMWVTCPGDGEVARIDPTTLTVERIAVGGIPVGITADTRSVWIADNEGGALVELDPATGALSRHPVPISPWWLRSGQGAVWATGRDGTGLVRVDPGGEVSTGGAISAETAGLAILGDQVVVADRTGQRLVWTRWG